VSIRFYVVPKSLRLLELHFGNSSDTSYNGDDLTNDLSFIFISQSKGGMDVLGIRMNYQIWAFFAAGCAKVASATFQY